MDNNIASNKKSISLLEVNNLATGYKLSRSKIIELHQNLKLSIKEGELVALLGPNGAGKSTLIRTLIGMLPSLNGNIYYKGKSLNELSHKDIAKNVALVLTDKIEDMYLTSFDIVGTGRYPYGSFVGKLSEDDHAKIKNALILVGAFELINRYFYSLSDGEKQKVLLARAIAQDTPLIILDEPTAFIDSPGKIEIMRLLTDLVVKHQKSILMTTHDTELALIFASRLILLGKEGLFVDGNPDELVKNGTINRFFDRKGVVFNKANRKFETE